MKDAAQAELETLWNRSTAVYAAKLQEIGIAWMKDQPEKADALTTQLAQILSDTMILSDLHGRRRTFLESDRMPAPKEEDQDKVVFRESVVVPSASFTEAIMDLLIREPRLKRGYKDVQKAYARQHVFALAKRASQETLMRVQSYLADAAERGDPEDKAGVVIAKIGDWSDSYGRMVYRTNMATSYTAGRFQAAMDPEVAEVMGAFEYFSVRDPDTRENHKAAHGLIAPINHAIWQVYSTPMGYNSFAPDTRVSGQFESASKALYAGPIVKIQTRKGCRLSVTPNHPILTPRGYVAAGDLREGDDLFVHLPTVNALARASRNWNPSDPTEGRGAVHDQQMPARIEDVFKASHRQRTAATMETFARTFPLDFHGDARFYKGKVHIVGTDGLLPDHGEFTPEKSTDRDFMPSYGSALLLRHGGGVSLSDKAVGIGPAAKLDTCRPQPGGDARARGMELLREFKDAGAGEIERDQISGIDVGTWEGHVFDLQSPFGWIVAEGIIASNCRCSLRAVSRMKLQRMGLISRSGIVQVHKPAGFSKAHPDEGFGGGRPDFNFYRGAMR